MATKDLKIPPKALVICGVIYSPQVSLSEIKSSTEASFGNIILEAGPVPFTWTSYYEREMGKGLLRSFFAFETLMAQDSLADMKHQAMALEEKWMVNGSRMVNIDPGILTAERLVLATTKNFTHRIYLGKGIFGDLTLIYQKGGFSFLDWTYPDYRSEIAIDFLTRARRLYLDLIKTQRG